MINTNQIHSKETNRNSHSSHSATDLAGWEEKVMTAITNLVDMIERAGDSVEDKGYEKIGQAIYQLGDKIEHLGAGPRRFANKDHKDRETTDRSADLNDEKKVKYNS